MGAEVLSSRAIIGMFYETLEQNTGQTWIDLVSNLFDSDQAKETYPWIGQVPTLREWIGGRHAKGFNSAELTIENLHLEATIEILVKELRRDKTGQLRVRIGELADRATSNWAKLLSALILNGETQPCYDGQYFFDTDHEEGKSGVQSNKITTDISALPTEVHGVPTAPSVAEFQQAVAKSITQLTSFKDDQGEPINEMAREFLVMVPTSLLQVAQSALSVPRGTNLEEIVLPDNVVIRVVANVRLNAWTDKFVTLRTDGRLKAFIRQQEEDLQMKAKAEGSEYEFDNDAHQYGIDTWRNVGFGRWHYAVLNQLI
ncbi:MAG: Mu-like prophage major head subunit gpT family protein [Pseudomonas sp.]|nr:Mu-like prophage major head subunit gpT family protein [Pseudomonas sp.]